MEWAQKRATYWPSSGCDLKGPSFVQNVAQAFVGCLQSSECVGAFGRVAKNRPQGEESKALFELSESRNIERPRILQNGITYYIYIYII